MVKNIIIAVLALAVVGLGLVLVLRHPGKVGTKDEQEIVLESKKLIDHLTSSYAQVDLPGFFKPFSRDPGALHIWGMKTYTNIDSLQAQLQMDFTRIRAMKLFIQGSQVMPIDSRHALITAQGTVRYTDIGGQQSMTMIYNWTFYTEKRGDNWVIIRSQQGFSR